MNVQTLNQWGSLAKQLASSQELAATAKELMMLYREGMTHDTERARINAVASVAIADIDSQRELLLKFFEHAFAERAQVFGGQFRALDQALAMGNVEIAASTLNAIVATVKTSPLASVPEFRQALSRRETIKLE